MAATARLIVLKKDGMMGGLLPIEPAASIRIGRRAHSLTALGSWLVVTDLPNIALAALRDPDKCDIQIKLPEVSKEQAVLEADSSRQVWIQNLSQTNPGGTMLNDAPVRGRTLLHVGDIISICGRRFLYHDGATPAEQPEPAAPCSARHTPSFTKPKTPRSSSAPSFQKENVSAGSKRERTPTAAPGRTPMDDLRNAIKARREAVVGNSASPSPSSEAPPKAEAERTAPSRTPSTTVPASDSQRDPQNAAKRDATSGSLPSALKAAIEARQPALRPPSSPAVLPPTSPAAALSALLGAAPTKSAARLAVKSRAPVAMEPPALVACTSEASIGALPIGSIMAHPTSAVCSDEGPVESACRLPSMGQNILPASLRRDIVSRRVPTPKLQPAAPREKGHASVHSQPSAERRATETQRTPQQRTPIVQLTPVSTGLSGSGTARSFTYKSAQQRKRVSFSAALETTDRISRERNGNATPGAVQQSTPTASEWPLAFATSLPRSSSTSCQNEGALGKGCEALADAAPDRRRSVTFRSSDPQQLAYLASHEEPKSERRRKPLRASWDQTPGARSTVSRGGSKLTPHSARAATPATGMIQQPPGEHGAGDSSCTMSHVDTDDSLTANTTETNPVQGSGTAASAALNSTTPMSAAREVTEDTAAPVVVEARDAEPAPSFHLLAERFRSPLPTGGRVNKHVRFDSGGKDYPVVQLPPVCNEKAASADTLFSAQATRQDCGDPEWSETEWMTWTQMDAAPQPAEDARICEVDTVGLTSTCCSKGPAEPIANIHIRFPASPDPSAAPTQAESAAAGARGLQQELDAGEEVVVFGVRGVFCSTRGFMPQTVLSQHTVDTITAEQSVACGLRKELHSGVEAVKTSEAELDPESGAQSPHQPERKSSSVVEVCSPAASIIVHSDESLPGSPESEYGATLQDDADEGPLPVCRLFETPKVAEQQLCNTPIHGSFSVTLGKGGCVEDGVRSGKPSIASSRRAVKRYSSSKDQLDSAPSAKHVSAQVVAPPIQPSPHVRLGGAKTAHSSPALSRVPGLPQEQLPVSVREAIEASRASMGLPGGTPGCVNEHQFPTTVRGTFTPVSIQEADAERHKVQQLLGIFTPDLQSGGEPTSFWACVGEGDAPPQSGEESAQAEAQAPRMPATTKLVIWSQCAAAVGSAVSASPVAACAQDAADFAAPEPVSAATRPSAVKGARDEEQVLLSPMAQLSHEDLEACPPASSEPAPYEDFVSARRAFDEEPLARDTHGGDREVLSSVDATGRDIDYGSKSLSIRREEAFPVVPELAVVPSAAVQSVVSQAFDDLRRSGSLTYDDVPASLASLKVSELRSELACRSLSTQGKKAELVERLRCALTPEVDIASSRSAPPCDILGAIQCAGSSHAGSKRPAVEEPQQAQPLRRSRRSVA